MKQTGKIKDKPGSIALAKRGLWFTAAEKLHEASLGIEQMSSAQNRVKYESGWIRFLDSIQEFWVHFTKEGEDLFSKKFKPWAGKINAERKRDPLLRYLYKARNQTQHAGLPIEWEEPSIQIAKGYFGHIKSLEVMSNRSFEVDASPLGDTHNQVNLDCDPGNPLLPVLEDKKNTETYEPPTDPSGNPLSPLAASQMAHKYYSSVLQAAVEKFSD